MRNDKSLSRREREIMDIIYEMKEASAQQVMERLPSPPSYSAVRALLRVLEKRPSDHRQDVTRVFPGSRGQAAGASSAIS
jgi:predicted transcriptional regulator